MSNGCIQCGVLQGRFTSMTFAIGDTTIIDARIDSDAGGIGPCMHGAGGARWGSMNRSRTYKRVRGQGKTTLGRAMESLVTFFSQRCCSGFCRRAKISPHYKKLIFQRWPIVRAILFATATRSVLPAMRDYWEKPAFARGLLLVESE